MLLRALFENAVLDLECGDALSGNLSPESKRAAKAMTFNDMRSAYKMGDRIIMLHNGKIIADGDVDHIRNHPHPTVQQFIHGQVSEDDLAVLRMSSDIASSQFLPRDFER